QAYLAKFSPSFIGVGSRVDTARHKFGRATRASGSVEQDLAGNAAIGKRAGNAPVSLAAGAECSRLRCADATGGRIRPRPCFDVAEPAFRGGSPCTNNSLFNRAGRNSGIEKY